jgi:heavy metal sensor kinase
MTLSIRLRLTIWYSALMIAALAAFSVAILWLHVVWGRAQFDSELASLGSETARVMQEELGESGRLQQAVLEASHSIDVPDRAMAILDADGKPLAARWQAFAYDAANPIIPADQRPQIQTVYASGTAWRVLLQRESSPAGNYIILVAGSLEPLSQQHVLLRRVLLVATPLIVFLTAGVCWLVASSALRPVTRMATQAEAITAQSLHWQLDATTRPDELGQLSRAFNSLLQRLGNALQMQRQFMADASHELRTPVSVIQTATEVTLERERRDWEYQDALQIIQEQSARLSRTVEDMLVLARADAGGYRLALAALYLEEIVGECVKAASVLANREHVILVAQLESDVLINADDGLLRQLVTNLIDNAICYTPFGGGVTVKVGKTREFATLAVANTGPGIPVADRERVFERFVRLDPARSSASGAGLGLPIARWIAEQHGGTLTLEQDATGQTVFVARLPLKRPRTIAHSTGDANTART